MNINKYLVLCALTLITDYGLRAMDDKNWNMKYIEEILPSLARDLQESTNLRKKDIAKFRLANAMSLINAAKEGNVIQIQKYVDAGRNLDIVDATDMTALMHCAIGNHINCAKLLIDNDADLDLQDDCGYTALHWAAQKGHLDFVKLLLESGANKELICAVGLKGTAEQLARAGGYAKTAQLIKNFITVDKTPSSQRSKMVEFLLKELDKDSSIFIEAKDCEKCHKENSTKQCSVCKVVYYCSQACQKADWPAHRFFLQRK